MGFLVLPQEREIGAVSGMMEETEEGFEEVRRAAVLEEARKKFKKVKRATGLRFDPEDVVQHHVEMLPVPPPPVVETRPRSMMEDWWKKFMVSFSTEGGDEDREEVVGEGEKVKTCCFKEIESRMVGGREGIRRIESIHSP